MQAAIFFELTLYFNKSIVNLHLPLFCISHPILLRKTRVLRNNMGRFGGF